MIENMVLNIGHFYPDLLNLYGDRGNVLSIIRRAELMGIHVNLKQISIGDDFDINELDLCFIGGGQDNDQNILMNDFINIKGQKIIEMIEDNVVFLCICGGYQMLGKYYKEHDGSMLKCLGALDFYTIGEKNRFINDTIYDYNGIDIVGFENHSGRTYLGKNVKPFMTVKKGNGNNGIDKTEGANYKNTFCTYSHGSFLPKNPEITDMLIEKAMNRKYKGDFVLPVIDSSIERTVRNQALNYIYGMQK